jgi:hypothetical protein
LICRPVDLAGMDGCGVMEARLIPPTPAC